MGLRIIQFRDNTWALRKGWVFYKYLGKDSSYWWASCEAVHKWAKFSSEQQARDALSKIDMTPKQVKKVL